MAKRKPAITTFLHTFNANGKLEYQASLIEPEDGGWWVQLYSPLHGEPTDEYWLSNRDIHDPGRCRLYVDHATWCAAFEEYFARDLAAA